MRRLTCASVVRTGVFHVRHYQIVDFRTDDSLGIHLLLKKNHFDVLEKVKLPQSDSRKQVQGAQTDWFDITRREEFTQNSTTQADVGHSNLDGLGLKGKGVSKPINNLVLTDVTSADRQPKRKKRSFKHRRRKRSPKQGQTSGNTF